MRYVDPVQRGERVVGDPELGRVVGHVADRARALAHRVAEGATALVGDLEGPHREALDLERAGVHGVEGPGADQALGRDRERRRRHRLGDQVAPGLAALRGQDEPHRGAGPVAGREERQPLHVVPVHVADQDGAAKGRALEHRR